MQANQDVKEGHEKKWWGIDFKGRYLWFTIGENLKRELGMRDWETRKPIDSRQVFARV